MLCLASGCEWKPIARPVQPELVLAGSVRVDTLLGNHQRHALITRDPSGERRRAIVEWDKKQVCDLPPNITRINNELVDATSEDGPEFLLPLSIGEPSSPELYFSDEHCVLRGPYGRIAGNASSLVPDGTQQMVAVFGDGQGTLSLINPWTEELHVIATGVKDVANVRRPTIGDRPVGQQALWLIENGKLVQRTLAGEELLSLGTDVSVFDQALFDTLRIAYVDGPNVFEAAGPSFRPVLLGTGCRPRYSGSNLDFFAPCEDRQLVRIDLTTAEVSLFDPGVSASYVQAGFKFEYQNQRAPPDTDEEDQLLLFVTPPDGVRTQVVPTLDDDVQVIDAYRILGRTQDDQIGVWDIRSGFTPLFSGVGVVSPFVDTRTNRLLWLIQHEIEDRLGRLSIFSQEAFTLETVADGVPVTGYSVEFVVQLSEPMVVLLEQSQPLPESGGRFQGTLFARLLSGELSSVIDQNVSSYATLIVPLPALLYSVEDGDRTGLWFAAL